MDLTYKFFKEWPVTRILISKIMSGAFPDVKTSYRVKKLVEELSSEFEIFKQILTEKEQVIKFDEKTRAITNQDEVSKVFAEFYAHSFKVEQGPLKKEELEAIKNVTPKEIELLEMISEPTAFAALLA